MKPGVYVCACLGIVAPLGLFAAASERRPVAIHAGRGSPGGLPVIISGELNGHLTPCGCSKPMLGGLPRRATYLASLRPDGLSVRIENGDLTEALGRQDQLKAETVVEALSLLKYDAINLGEKDFRLGIPYLQSLQLRFKGALLCANARTAAGGPLFGERTFVMREVEGRKVRIAIVGVISDQYEAGIRALNPEARMESPSESLTRLQPELAAASDARILLFHGPKQEAEELGKRFTSFQVVVYAHMGDHPAELERIGSVTLAGGGQDGKYASHAVLSAEKSWLVDSIKNQPLVPDFTDDGAMMELMSGYLQRVTAENLLGKVPKSPTEGGASFLGSAACSPCHHEESRAWQSSGHATAYRTLIGEKHDKDPECVTCHVVGLERVGGFANHEGTPHLENVGCESCHGPASKHAADSKVKLGKAGSTSCQPCHVPQHSPNFDFDKYWPRIRHGRAAG